MSRNGIDDLPGLKEGELIKLGNCIICGKPQLGREPMFYCVSIKRGMFDARQIQRRVGLEMMLGNGPLARVMGPDADLAKVFDGPREAFVHEGCAGDIGHILQLMPKDSAEKTDAA